MFSWKPIYHEIATALMGYRDRQGELIDLIKAMHEAKLPAVALMDKASDGQVMPLTEIDPFTFFASFNRGTTDQSRQDMLRIIKDGLRLDSSLPKDFHGIPLTNPLQSRFFPHADVRKAGDIPALWDLATACVAGPPEKMSADLLSRCLGINSVAIPKLTMALFWFNPDAYLSLDSPMVEYLQSKGINVKPSSVKSVADYLSVVDKVRNLLGGDFPQISHNAYLFANQVPASPEELDKGFRKLLQDTADTNGVGIADVIAHLADREEAEGQNEITNRIGVMPQLRDALDAKPLDLTRLRDASRKLWALGNGQDEMRRTAFFRSKGAADSIAMLLDDPSGMDDLSRIDRFIEEAVSNGYTDPAGKDLTNAVQFSSVLMSAMNPDQYVDYRVGRWNKLFRLVTGSNKNLCGSGSHAWNIMKAGKFAAMLAATPTFREYFGTEHGPWKVAALAWDFRNGLPDVPLTSPSPKRYWAGGALWGGTDNKRDEFMAANYWQIGWEKDNPKATHFWDMIRQIRKGDELAIKGLGGRYDLRVYYVGEVTDVELDQGIVRLRKLDRLLYHDKAPKHAGNGSWFGTILEITNPDAIQSVFGLKSAPPPPNEPFPQNQILYGPPGTGKTYRASHEAVRIIDGSTPERTPEELQQRFDELVDEGRVCFATFHQSYAYEDFVEGIRPILDGEQAGGVPRYECRDGLFKQMAIEALFASLEPAETPDSVPDFDARWDALLNTIQEDPDREYQGLTEKTSYSLEVSSRGNVLGRNLRNSEAGPYLCSRRNLRKVVLAYPDQAEVSIREVNDALGVGNHAHLACVVFRELMSLSAVAPAVPSSVEGVSYEDRKDIVQEYLRLREDSGYRLKPPAQCLRHVLIVDEINRGNISKILGELVTLLEPDKRIGGPRQLRPSLPYSGDRFGVPGNLYVLGTMNTADKSIALVDVALRRRFRFTELMPDLAVCPDLSADMRQVLAELNKRISLRKDRDHQIGHSYFMDVKTPEEFDECFCFSVIPLLQEYFYNDWDGLRYVLGDENGTGFIRKIEGSEVKGSRNKWQWFFDVPGAEIDCLDLLRANYKLGGEASAE